ncbi:hypothetical protein KIS1582_5092, partial [Cytobacillus firmus]
PYGNQHTSGFEKLKAKLSLNKLIVVVTQV